MWFIAEVFLILRSLSGTVLNRRCYLKRYVDQQKNPDKFKAFEIKVSRGSVRRPPKETQYVLFRGNNTVRNKAGGAFNVIARRYPAEGPFKSADEMWSYTDGGVGLGIEKQQLDKYWNGKTHGYLHRVADSVVCPEEYFWWDDSCTNNAGFLPLKTLASRRGGASRWLAAAARLAGWRRGCASRWL